MADAVELAIDATLNLGRPQSDAARLRGHGFTTVEVVSLLKTAIVASVDTCFDLVVLHRWWLAGDTGWFRAGVGIQVLSGCFMGYWLTITILPPTLPSLHPAVRKALGLVLGLLGLAPAAVAFLTLNAARRGVDDLMIRMILKLSVMSGMIEVIFEAIPQAGLQTYVGVAYGEFDPAHPAFSFVMVLSVASACLSGGVAIFAFEVQGRVQKLPLRTIRADSLYGLSRIIAAGALLGTVMFIQALVLCAWKAYAAVVLLLAVAIQLFRIMIASAGADPVQICGLAERAMGILTEVIAVAFIMMLWLLFALLPHIDNNYGDKTAQDGSAAATQHLACQERVSAIHTFYILTAVYVLSAVLGKVLDPEWGVWTTVESRNQLLEAKQISAGAVLKARHSWKRGYRDGALGKGAYGKFEHRVGLIAFGPEPMQGQGVCDLNEVGVGVRLRWADGTESANLNLENVVEASDLEVAGVGTKEVSNPMFCPTGWSIHYPGRSS